MIEFNEEKHEYTLDGKKLISVTQLMQKHGLSPNYSNVNADVLKAKAERGTLIHKEIENYIKHGEIGFTTERAEFAGYIHLNAIEPVQSEMIVYNDVCAGTLDLVLKQDGKYYIADIKTTSELHIDSVSWQLSIYAYLYDSFGYGCIKDGIDGAKAYHFDKDGNLNVADIPLKPIEEVEKLFQCERDGRLYKQELTNVGNELAELTEIETYIAKVEEQKKAAETRAVELRMALIKAMQDNAVKTFENDNIRLTLVDPVTRTTIDSAKLKKEMPEIAEKYSKSSTTKASLRITLKGEKQ